MSGGANVANKKALAERRALEQKKKRKRESNK
jgi:hypothetical protein